MIKRWADIKQIEGKLILSFLGDDDEGNEPLIIMSRDDDNEWGLVCKRKSTLSLDGFDDFSQKDFDALTTEKSIKNICKSWFD